MDTPSEPLTVLLPIEAIRLDVTVTDWRAAIAAAGDALVAVGTTTPEYTAEMIAAVEEYGPYMVIAPGIALAHSRPSPAVLRVGLSWVRLAEPVEFGHADNDPVTLVVGLASTDHRAHVRALATVAQVLSDAPSMEALAAAETPEQVRATIAGFEEATTGTDT